MTLQQLFKKFAAIAALTLSVANISAVHAENVPPEVRFAWAGGPRVWILGKIDKSFDQAFGAPVKWIPFATGADVLSLFAAKEIDIARFGSPVSRASCR
jgi:taurine transport system substrate-binding protein